MKSKFKKLKTKKDIENDSRVKEIWSEYDGCWGGNVKAWWCILNPGFEAYGNQQHTIHERTIKDVCSEIDDVIEWPDDPALKEK